MVEHYAAASDPVRQGILGEEGRRRKLRRSLRAARIKKRDNPDEINDRKRKSTIFKCCFML
jgi:hypothetical protein